MNEDTCVCESVLSVVEINGVPIHALSPRGALSRVEAMLKCPGTHIINHIPADPIVLARRDPAFRSALRRADLNLPDGMGVVWAARALGIEDSRERVYGPDFMLKVIESGIDQGIRHALVGGSSSTLEALVRSLRRRVPGLKIVAAHSPPMRPVTQDAVLDDLSNISNEADIIWIGLGTPKQQAWADLARNIKSPRIILTVGAAFDFLAGTKPQAPIWMQKNGFEWLFRLAKEPRRLWRRYLLGNPLFVWSVIAEAVRRSRATKLGHGGSSTSRTRPGQLHGIVLLVGPDGAGKTTIAEHLRVLASSNGLELSTAHSRPGVLVKRRRNGKPVTEPHRLEPRRVTQSLLKLIILWFDYLIGWVVSWRPRSRESLLVIERGWFDQAIDPRRYRIPAALTPLVELLGGLLPRADVSVILAGDASTLHTRKPEISEEEVTRQIEEWRRLAPRTAQRVLEIDTSRSSPRDSAHQIWTYLAAGRHSGLWRQIPFSAPRLSLRTAGNSTALSVYRPHSRIARLANRTYPFILRSGLARQSKPPFDQLEEVLKELSLDIDGIAAFRSSAPDRWILGISRNSDLQVVLKAGPNNDHGLRNEAEFLAKIGALPSPFTIPRIVWSGLVDNQFILATEAVSVTNAEADVEVAAEIATYLVRGIDGMGPVVHGDLAPWNILPTSQGWLVIDWESAKCERAPLYDVTSFVTRVGSLLNRYSPEQAVRLLVAPGSPGSRHLAALELDIESARSLVRLNLENLDGNDRRTARYLHDMKMLLDGRHVVFSF